MTSRLTTGLAGALLGAAFVLCAAQAPAQLCVSDCNEDAFVAVEEMRTCIDIGLGRSGLATCAVCNAGGDPGVTVEDLILGVRDALGVCSVSPEESGQAGTAGALDGVGVLGDAGGIMDLGLLGTGGGGSLPSGLGTLPDSLFPPPSFIARGLPGFTTCPGGGFANLRCTVEGQRSFLEALYVDCTFTDQLGSRFFNGDQLLDVPGQSFCEDLQIDLGTPFSSISVELEFAFTVSESGAFRRELRRDAELLLRIDEPGCDFPIGLMEAEGAFTVSCSGSVPGFRRCTRPNAPIEYVYDRFKLNVAPIAGVQCGNRLTADGSVQAPQTGFAAVYENYVQALVATPNGTLTTIDGVQTLPCLGRSLLTRTEQQMLTPPGQPCPVSGALEIVDTTVDRVSRVTFTMSQGLVFDYDGDGDTDEEVSSCLDPALQRCFVSSPPPTPTPQGPTGLVCSPCERGQDCDPRLFCVECVTDCKLPTGLRCAPSNAVAECSDGVYGVLP